MLEQLRPALAAGMTRVGHGYVGPGEFGTVISEALAQQLIAIGWARLEGDRLVLEEE